MDVKTKGDQRSAEQLLAQRSRFEDGVNRAVRDRKLTVSEYKDIQDELVQRFSRFIDWKVDLGIASYTAATPLQKLTPAQRAVSQADVLEWVRERHPNLAFALQRGFAIRTDLDMHVDSFGRLDVVLHKPIGPADTVDGKPVAKL